MVLAFTPCIIIPCFNHGVKIKSVIFQLIQYEKQCIIVDDGSDHETASILDQLEKQYDCVTLLRHNVNLGKGNAVLTGIHAAQKLGFSHGLQVDADGQHDLNDIPKMLEKAKLSPDCVISGQPIYDKSVPKSRFYSRYITHVWVWIETLSFSIRDSMCGFRVYPIDIVVDLIKKVSLGTRMDFDTEILVRLYWMGTLTKFIPTKVIYPTDGISHFRVFQDNVRISWMHTRLFLQMLPRMPSLIKRNLTNTPDSQQDSEKHWSKIKECTGLLGLWGMQGLVLCYRILGRNVFNICLYPVIGYYWLFAKQARKASHNYLTRITHYAKNHLKVSDMARFERMNTFKHFRRFGDAMLDKVASWRGDIRREDIEFFNKSALLDQIASKQGTLLIGAHLGDFEVCRALGKLSFNVKINALIFSKNAARFNKLMHTLNPQSNINLIQVDELGVDVAIILKQKIDAGEWVAIVGDRTSLSSYRKRHASDNSTNRITWSNFLGEPAPFPQGPFILASILKCPCFLMFCLKPERKTPQQFEIHFEKFSEQVTLSRANRLNDLQVMIDHYAARLEYYCLRAPLDWFNFYDFWHLALPNNSVKPNKKINHHLDER